MNMIDFLLDMDMPMLSMTLKQFLNHVSSYIEPLPPRFYRQQTEYNDPRIYYDNYQADTPSFSDDRAYNYY